MGDQNIGVLQQTLTVLCDVVGTLEQIMYHLSHNVTDQLIGVIFTDAPRDDFEVRISTLISEFGGVRKLTEGCGFNTIVVYLKSLEYVTVWVRANLPSVPQNWKTSCIWIFYWQGFSRQDLAVKRPRTSKFTLV